MTVTPTSSNTEKMPPLPPTDMIYMSYDGNFQLECDATVLTCQVISGDDEKKEENGNDDGAGSAGAGMSTVELCLDKTVMHAQGGGQPTDVGAVSLIPTNNSGGDAVEVSIEKVLLDRSNGVAKHTGKVNSNLISQLREGSSVHVTVDAAKRRILSECHTAGHILDMSMAKCGKIMPPSKAYHFLEGPYVEYKGNIPVEERPALLEQLQKTFAELVEEDIETKIEVLDKADAQQVCDRVADNYFNLNDFVGDRDKTVRIVTVAGWSCPCGGTHVKSTGELSKEGRQWNVTGLKSKKGVVRVKYGYTATATN